MFATQDMEDPLSSASPRLNGNSEYMISNNQITINIDAITNDRPVGDISGTLAIELWALKQPYSGGDFSGECLAASEIGEVLGQHYLANCHLVLNFREPAVGSWHLCLMLREWTANGYVTRDQINFDHPYTVSWKPELVKTSADNVVNIPVADNDNNNDLADTSKASKPATDRGDELVNLNKASIEEIAGVKNISKNLATNIVNNRPFASLDELLQVKGMGSKLLARVQDLIKL